eukprot:365485-Chlamydomonas_euryale.AAC.8
MDGWTIDVHMDGWMDKCMDGWMVGWTNEWMGHAEAGLTRVPHLLPSHRCAPSDAHEESVCETTRSASFSFICLPTIRSISCTAEYLTCVRSPPFSLAVCTRMARVCVSDAFFGLLN